MVDETWTLELVWRRPSCATSIALRPWASYLTSPKLLRSQSLKQDDDNIYLQGCWAGEVEVV